MHVLIHLNTSQNASKSFTVTLFKCSKPRRFRGLCPPPPPVLDPLGTLSGPQTPCWISSPLTSNPESAHGYTYVSETQYIGLLYFVKKNFEHAPFCWLFTFITIYFYNISYCVFRPIETTVSTLNLAWLLWHNKFDMIRTPHNLCLYYALGN